MLHIHTDIQTHSRNNSAVGFCYQIHHNLLMVKSFTKLCMYSLLGKNGSLGDSLPLKGKSYSVSVCSTATATSTHVTAVMPQVTIVSPFMSS